ncbi:MULTISPECIES: hypothetical protein [Streptomyces]|uniref:hypothetical protein n=1 Tax=Streptomyces TaxID=1883 RepID=UPI001D04BAD6|nr:MULTISPECIES: hypothetical protein [Streptomyces]
MIPGQLAAWVTGLPLEEKNRLLLRGVEDDAATVRMEMIRRFRDQHATSVPVPSRRTVVELLDVTSRRRADRKHRAAAEEARREKARALALESRLNELAGDEDAAWSRVGAMIATRKLGDYDAAVALLTDLKALAQRDGQHDTFIRRRTALRQTHARKLSLIERLNRAGV